MTTKAADDKPSLTVVSDTDHGKGKGATLTVGYNAAFVEWFSKMEGEWSEEKLSDWIVQALETRLQKVESQDHETDKEP